MKISQVAAQLFTCRDLLQTPAEIAATLRRIRAAGYTAVQVSGMGPIAEEELNKILDGEGLVCCATHEPANTILTEPQKVIERLQKLRCNSTAYPYPAGIDFGSRASIDGLISRLDEAGAMMAGAGITLCYHNHNLEFRKIDGRTVLDQIYEGTKPGHLQGELDTYWVHYGGGDNVAWCRKLAGRLPLLHLKDYMTTDQNAHTYCDVGAGLLDFAAIIGAAEQSGCQWFIVELDHCPGDPVDSLRNSFDYIQTHLLS